MENIVLSKTLLKSLLYFKKNYNQLCKIKFNRKIKTSILGMLAHDYYIEYILQPTTELVEESNRMNFCRKLSTNLMNDVISRLYVDQNLHDLSSMEEYKNRANIAKNLFEYVYILFGFKIFFLLINL